MKKRVLTLTTPIALAFIGLFSLVWLFIPAPIFAVDYTVGGICGSTIQACINFAAPGDTIIIPAGNYNESLTLIQPISLTGVSSATTIIQAVANRRVLTVAGAAVDNSSIISGLTFTGGDVSGGGRAATWL